MIVSLLAGAMLLSPPLLDDASMGVLKASQAKLAAASSVSGSLIQGAGDSKVTYKFRLAGPNLIDIVSDQYEYHSDGKDMYMYMVGQKEFQKMAAPKSGLVLMLVGFEPVVGGKSPAIKEASSTTFAGKPAVKAKLPGSGQVEQAIYIDKETSLPLGWTQTYSGQTMTFTYANLKLGEKMNASAFAWTPPAGASEYKQPDFMASLLKDGAEAPDFTNATPTGGKINLKETIGKSKAVLLNFWFYG